MALKKEDKRKLKTTEMRMQCIRGKTLKDVVSNETILELAGMEKKEEFLSEQRVQWFRNVEMMKEAVKAKNYVVDGSKMQTKEEIERGYQKRHAGKRFKKSDAQDHAVWRPGCKNQPTHFHW